MENEEWNTALIITSVGSWILDVGEGGYLRRLEKRLAVIQNAHHDETTCVWSITLRLIDSKFFFPEIPSEETAENSSAKRNGFHWSPIAGAWQRYRSNSATYLAKLILTNHNRLAPRWHRVEAFIVFSKYLFYYIYKLAYRSAIEGGSELNYPERFFRAIPECVSRRFPLNLSA